MSLGENTGGYSRLQAPGRLRARPVPPYSFLRTERLKHETTILAAYSIKLQPQTQLKGWSIADREPISHPLLWYAQHSRNLGSASILDVVMCIMMLMASNRKIMGELTLPIYLKVFGWAATLIMASQPQECYPQRKQQMIHDNLRSAFECRKHDLNSQ
jgi:hypothetical protein